MTKVLSSNDLINGKEADLNSRGYGQITQPTNFLPEGKKDLAWASSYMNYIEWQGMIQLRRNLNWMSKNYNLARGIIDKEDYIKSDTEYTELIDNLTEEGVSALELKFYPLIPIIVDTLTNEFSKRTSKITFDLKDEESYNEMLQQKYEEVEQSLIAQATIKQQSRMMQLGLTPESDEGKQMLDPSTIKSLPQIQEFYTKTYRSMYQEWAEHVKNIDDERFYMPEQERLAFWESLVVDRAFFEMRMFENDYLVRRWNPKQTFYRKSPNERWISNGQWVGMIDLMTVSDVIDNYGWMMSQDQLLALNTLFPVRGATYMLDGKQNDGSYYDPTKPYEWNRTGPGLAMRQLMSTIQGSPSSQGPGMEGDIVNFLFADSEDTIDTSFAYMVRVSTIYWKTQRKVGHLTKVMENGEMIQDIVSEDYKVTDKPLYNTLVYKEKTKNNVVFGEHIDWLWINEVWGGLKIGPNLPIYGWMSTGTDFAPMYIGVNGGKPGRLPFQFKGDSNLYGCKLPVEGSVFSDYNTHSRSMVDKLKPWQIGYNMVNNQIMDLMVDELGVIITFDPNALPKHSMGEDWGPDNFAKSMAVMRDFSMLPLNSSIASTEIPVNPNHFQKLDLTQSQRFITKVQLSKYFKEEGLAAVGLNPQRMGQPIDQEQTATGIQQAVAASYSATEQYFTQFSDELMPRVHQMRTDLAQYYACTNPSLRLQYTTSDGMKQWFNIDGTKLLGRDIGVGCKTKINSRNILQQIKQVLMTNNTSGANIYDLVRGIKAETVSEIDSVMKAVEQRVERESKQKQEADQQAQEAQQQHELQLMQAKQEFDAQQKELDREAHIREAEIRSAGFSGAVDLNQNKQNDYLDNLKAINAQQNSQNKMDLDREKHVTQTALDKEKLDIQRQKIQAEDKRTQQQIQVAKINNKVKEKNKTK